jgi:serine O-acetyltransferase
MAAKPKLDASADVADRLIESYRSGELQHVNSYELPSLDAVARIVERTRALLFPGFFGASLVRATPTELRAHVREQLDELRNALRRQVYRGLHQKEQADRGTQELDCPHCAARAENISERFLDRLVVLRDRLALDARAHFESDPASTSLDEIIHCYPGFYAVSVYRIAHDLLALGSKVIPRMMTELAHVRVGIDIHPGARVGESFFIDHGTGVVIGETAVIGDRVRIYQGVTLGALSVKDRGQVGVQRHPTIEDDVIVYAGATILGGDTVIGEGAVIGGNCWVTRSVAPGIVVTLDGATAP